VPPQRPGYVAAVDARAIGLAVLALGGGRHKPGDTIDYAVGFDQVAAIGSEVGPDRPLARLHARDEASAERAATLVRRHAVAIAAAPPPARPVILDRIGASPPG
jgi:thymidine phosphorylase